MTFDSVKIGDGCTIRQCVAIDNREDINSPEYFDLCDYENWKNIPDEQILLVGTHAILIHGGNNGAFFHLAPAMSYVVKRYEGFLNPEGVYDVFSSVIFCLERDEIKNKMNNDQMVSVVYFLKYLLETIDDLMGYEDNLNALIQQYSNSYNKS